jgi:trehalose 6-phosphate phosphatase
VPESSRRSDASLSRTHALAAAALAEPPAGLLTDFDGTLSPIVADPALARLVDGTDGALARLAERLAVVAIVTGREPAEARRLIGVPGILVAGNHGTEWLEPGADVPSVPPGADAVRGGLDAVLSRLPELPGVMAEHKGMSASVHYRNAIDPDAARAAILGAIGDVEPHGLRIGHGRMVVELRPVGIGDKGTAARDIIERHALRGVMVMGDDVTDLDMFGAVAELREAGTVRAAIIAVGGADREAPPELSAAADVALGGPAQAALLLARLAG